MRGIEDCRTQRISEQRKETACIHTGDVYIDDVTHNAFQTDTNTATHRTCTNILANIVFYMKLF